jgi:kumamolisin
MNPRFGQAARPLAAMLLFFGFGVAVSKGAAAGFETVTGSVRLPDANGLTIGHGRIVRAQLTPAELSETMRFSVTLRMRDLEGLQARIASGEQIAESEMESAYRPLRGDFDRVSAWLTSEGFTLTLPDRTHTSVFAQGTVANVARAFGVTFARVTVSDGEYTSAVQEPRVPSDLAGVVLSVNGLQPEFRLRHIHSRKLSPEDLYGGSIYVTPDNVASAYDFPNSATGAGQTIAIVGEGAVATSDLTAFWNAVGVSQTVSNFASVNVGGGPNNSSGAIDEADLDVEWAGAMAPGAALRLYLANNIFDTFAQILNDLPRYPSMTVVSVSYGDTEGDQGSGTLRSFSQTFAQLAAAGVSVFASSGDSGSNPTPGSGAGGYSASNPLAVNYPASDPSVTGVGGTGVEYTGNWVYSGEIVWNQITTTTGTSGSASGGGVSSFFAKPSWQTGGSVLAGQTLRCVPDVSAISVGDLNDVIVGAKYAPSDASDVGVLVIIGGAVTGRAGTSLSCPVWAAVAAVINQARVAAGGKPMGLINPLIYPLQGTSAFNDITSGTNGAYSAGPGYDLCSGLGSPNVANLISVLSGTTSPAARVLELSTRAQVQTGQNIVIGGFIISGGSGTSKSVLVRGIGPALTGFQVSGALAQPVLGIYDGSTVPVLIASNTGWGNAPVAGTSTVKASYRQATAADMSSVGAFPLAAKSADCAMVLTLPPGSYSAQVSGVGSSTGVVLAEVYDLDMNPNQTLTNISARCFVGTGTDVAISGLYIGGSQSARLLLRGIGPALAGFGLPNTVAQPSIALEDSNGTLIVSDTGWGNPLVSGTSSSAASYRLATGADMSAAGAFALNVGSLDSAMVVTLPPGSYTVELSAVGGSSGTGLAEIYKF